MPLTSGRQQAIWLTVTFQLKTLVENFKGTWLRKAHLLSNVHISWQIPCCRLLADKYLESHNKVFVCCALFSGCGLLVSPHISFHSMAGFPNFVKAAALYSHGPYVLVSNKRRPIYAQNMMVGQCL